MKKIMQINITCGVGSTGKLAEALYKAAIYEGYESRFAYSAFAPTIPDAFRIETTFQNYLRRGENKYFGKSQRHSLPGTRRLIHYIEQEKPDLIHIHNIQQNAVSYPVFFEYLNKVEIPIVYTLHDCWSFTGGCYHFILNHCDGYKNGCIDCQYTQDNDDKKITSAEALQIKKQLLLSIDNINFVCVSQWLKNLAEQSFLKEAKLLTIYNGIDTKLFTLVDVNRTELLGTDAEYIVLGVAGYWNEKRKGGDTFVEIAKKIYPEGRVVLVGSEADQISRRFPNGIIGIDRINDAAELAKYYSMADVFVNASREETFGLTTAEAMACGTPSIVFKASACSEIVDEDTGVLVETNDISEIEGAITKIVSKGKKFYKQNCRSRAVNRFDTAVMENAYMNLYRSVI